VLCYLEKIKDKFACCCLLVKRERYRDLVV
jgi:hypothetical protein